MNFWQEIENTHGGETRRDLAWEEEKRFSPAIKKQRREKKN